MRTLPDREYDEDQYLNDGELPSLTPKGSSSVGSHNQVPSSTERIMKARGDSKMKNRSPIAGRNEFWSQLDDSSLINEDDNKMVSRKPHRITNGNHHYVDDDGPDDEMAARHAFQNVEQKSMKSYDTVHSAPTDNESQLTEEEEEETYETSFCGQTLTAIGDMCGGNGNISGNGDEANNINKQDTKRRSTTSPPMDRKRWDSRSPISDGNYRTTHTEISHSDIQQENTAIEVEFVEPIKSTKSEDSNGIRSDVEKKNLRLNAIAKKAKENFMNRKGKSKVPVDTIKNESGNITGQSSTPVPVVSSEAIHRTDTDKSDLDLDSIYHSFNATEKRKFIKLINGGAVAAVATRQILDDRLHGENNAPKTDVQDINEDDVFEESDVDTKNQPTELTSTTDGTDLPKEKPGVAVENTDADLDHFKESGNLYYDAVRRDVDDDVISVDDDNQGISHEDNNNNGKTSFMGLELGVAQRFFNSGKPKGFTALPDSPEKKSSNSSNQKATDINMHQSQQSVSRPNEALLPDNDNDGIYDNPDTNVKEVSTDRSFDSFVRNRNEDIADFSLEAPDFSPNRDTTISDEHTENSTKSKYSDLSQPELIGSDDNHSPKSIHSTKSKSINLDTDLSQPELTVSEDQNSPKSVHSMKSNSVNLDTDLSQPISSKTLEVMEPEATGDQESVVLSTGDKTMLSTSILGQNQSVSCMDVSGDTYSNIITEINATNNDTSLYNDTVSVFTTGTNLTGATSYTQSSRIRRPGAAKTRLAKQKEIEQVSSKTGKGWHETIREAAQCTNRVWDPKKGWVDYEEPDIPQTDISSKKEKLRIDLSRSMISHKEGDSKNSSISRDASVQVPFPPEWIKERDSMIESIPDSKHEIINSMIESIPDSKNEIINVPTMRQVESDTTNIQQETYEINDLSTNAPASSSMGWVESMRLASASLAKDGLVWDPRYGWKSIDENGVSVTDMVDFDVETIPEERLGPEIPDTVDLDNPATYYANVEQKVCSLPEESQKSVPEIDVKNEETSPTDSQYQMKSNVPLRDGIKNDLMDVDIVTLEIEGDNESTLQVVEVIKQKVDQSDMELFKGNDQYSTRTDRSALEVAAPVVPSQANTSTISNDPSLTSSRRGSGPVDVDELDDTLDSDDDEQSHKGPPFDVGIAARSDERHHIDNWKDNAYNVPRTDSAIVPTQGYDMNRSYGNALSLSSGGSPTKKIPKLERSKRDTSPLSIRNHLDVAFPRSQESIRRHENIPMNVEYPVESTSNKNIPQNVEYPVEPTSNNVRNGHTDLAKPIAKTSPQVQGTKPLIPIGTDTSIVQARLSEWESRIEASNSVDAADPIDRGRPDLLKVVGDSWRSFLGKKVQSETAAAEAGNSKAAQPLNQQISDRGHEYSTITEQRTKVMKAEGDAIFDIDDKNETSELNLSNISPIQANDDFSEYEIASSVAYGRTEEERRSASFLERLTECAAPIMPTKPSALCGRPEEVADLDSLAEKSLTSINSVDKHRRSQSIGDDKPKSLTSLKGTSDAIRTSTSSVISEDFGAKTAFLDALAMKAAVSKPKRSSSNRRHDQSTTSSVVSGSTDHSEKWKLFLERKKASGASPITSRSSGAEISQAAEKYASDKVDEIMSKMAARSKPSPRSRDGRKDLNDEGDNNRTAVSNEPIRPRPAGTSISAAEDLAAARVEAMMAALSTANFDEGEI